jgi:hypothetical protein
MHNEELHNFSPNMIGKYKSRRMGWTWHVALMGEA